MPQFCSLNLYRIVVESGSLDQIQIHFNESQSFLLNICLGFIMFGIALDLKVSDFKNIASQKKSLIAGLVSQWIYLPILTGILIFLLKPQHGLAMGMVLIAASPGGNVSNYAVHYSKSNTALSIVLTSITTLMCVFTTPTLFYIMNQFIFHNEGNHSLQEVDIKFMDMALIVLKLIIIPSIAGLLFHYKFPNITKQIKKPINVLSLLIFTGFVAFGVGDNLDNLTNYISDVFYIVLIHNGLALLGGFAIARYVFGLLVSDARTISIETGIQNSGLALIIIFSIFNGLGSMALIAAWWSVWHLISAMAIATFWRRTKHI